MRLRATKLSAIGFGGSRAALPSLDLAFALDKTLTARKGPTPTFSRASGATEIGSDGFIRYAPENLLLQSETFGTTWTASQLNTTGTPSYLNVAESPIGTVTADKIIANTTTGTHQFRQDATLVAGVVYVLSCYFKAAEQQFASIQAFGVANGNNDWLSLFDVSSSPSTGTIIGFTNSSVTSVGNGWNRCVVVFTATASGSLSIRIGGAGTKASGGQFYTGDNSSGILVWGAQLERHTSARTYIPTTTAAVYGARFDHDPVTLASRGLLIEETRINTCTNSNLLTAVSWNQTALTVAPSGTAPDGSSAFEITEAAVNSGHALFNSGGATATANTTIAAGTAYTQSVFFKKSGSSINWVQLTFTSGGFGTTQYANFDIGNGVTGNSSGVTSRIESFPNGWYRCSITATASAPTTGFGVIINLIGNVDTTGRGSSYLGSTANKILASLGQFEAGSFPTSYIPTTTASVVRSADVCSITGSAFTSFWNQNEGTIVVVGDKTMSQNTTGSYLTFQAGATEVGPLITRTSTLLLGRIRNNTGQDLTNLDLSESPSGFKRIAVAWRATSDNNDRDYASGGLILPKTNPIAGTAANNQTNLLIGSRPSSAIFNGHISSLQYYRKRLTNAKLQSLTA